MSVIVRLLIKQRSALMKAHQTGFVSTTVVATKSTGSAQQQIDEYWKKNYASKRPMSPHLTIYKPQLTSMLSLAHRASGIALAGITVAFAGGTLLPPSVIETFMSAVDQVHSYGMGYICLFPLKFMLAWPVIYHACNGLRHLSWDAALGMKLGDIYKSGWFVLALSTILAAALSLAFTTK